VAGERLDQLAEQEPIFGSKESAMCQPSLWNSTQERIFNDCYATKAFRVAPMHTTISLMDDNEEYFGEAKAICEEFGLIPLMNFAHDFDVDIIGQFIATVFLGSDDAKTTTWITLYHQMTGTWAQFEYSMEYPDIENPRDHNMFRAHTTKKAMPRDVLSELCIPGRGIAGRSKDLLPMYDIMLLIYREVLNPKVGVHDKIHGYLVNLMHYTHKNRGKGKQLDVMNYLWEELHLGIIDRKAHVFAPYLMKFICGL
jgi:hypothetical protein